MEALTERVAALELWRASVESRIAAWAFFGGLAGTLAQPTISNALHALGVL